MVMEALLDSIQENRLDALYLFINEVLRDRESFNHFFQNLVSVLPRNWSIQRVEIGHEFLGMVQDQNLLFGTSMRVARWKSAFISRTYVPSHPLPHSCFSIP